MKLLFPLFKLGVFGLKGLPGLETLWQLQVPDLPHQFPALRVESAQPETG